MQTIEGRHYLDTREVAELIGVSPATLQNARSLRTGAGRIPFIKIGNAVLYREVDVNAYLVKGRK